MRNVMLLVAFGFVLVTTVRVEAQRAKVGRGVAGSGLEQGEVLVAVRSDVRLAIKGIRATLSDRLAGMTGEISARMPTIRECYSKLVATRPATVGGLRAVLVLEPGSAPPSVDITEVDGSDETLTLCVRNVLAALNFRDVERPAAVEITLSFDNTRARGQAQVDARQAAFIADVERNEDGSWVARWRTDNAEISFDLHVGSADGEALAQALVGAVRSGFSGFVDCRRRAGRQGMNADGELDLDLRIARDGTIAGRVTRNTLADQKRTPGCVEKAVMRLQLPVPQAPARASVTVRFAG